MTTWTDGSGFFSTGDLRLGGRHATVQEATGWLLGLERNGNSLSAGVQFLARSAEGLVYNGVAYQFDETSQQNITAMGTRAELSLADIAGVTWPNSFVFIASDNGHQLFTAAQFVALANAAAGRVIALRLAFRALKDSIVNAADKPMLDAIDVTQGWPA